MKTIQVVTPGQIIAGAVLTIWLFAGSILLAVYGLASINRHQPLFTIAAYLSLSLPALTLISFAVSSLLRRITRS